MQKERKKKERKTKGKESFRELILDQMKWGVPAYLFAWRESKHSVSNWSSTFMADLALDHVIRR